MSVVEEPNNSQLWHVKNVFAISQLAQADATGQTDAK